MNKDGRLYGCLYAVGVLGFIGAAFVVSVFLVLTLLRGFVSVYRESPWLFLLLCACFIYIGLCLHAKRPSNE